MAEPVTLTLTLNLDDHLARHLGYDEDGEPTQEPMSLEDLLIGLAAGKLVDRLISGPNHYVRSTRGADDPTKALRDALLAKADELAAARVAAHVEAAFDQVIHRTSDDGREVFTETLRDAIVKATEAATRLRPYKERDRLYRDNRSVLEGLVAEHVDRVVAREVTAAIDDAKNKARGEVSKRASDAIAKALAP